MEENEKDLNTATETEPEQKKSEVTDIIKNILQKTDEENTEPKVLSDEPLQADVKAESEKENLSENQPEPPKEEVAQAPINEETAPEAEPEKEILSEKQPEPLKEEIHVESAADKAEISAAANPQQIQQPEKPDESKLYMVVGLLVLLLGAALIVGILYLIFK